MTSDYANKYSGVRVMVLGSAGFIGRWVALKLCNAGARVCLPVRNSTSAKDVFNAFGIVGDVYELDLLDEEGVRSLYREVRPTVTFNLAGYGVDRKEQNEKLAYQINADLIRIVCEAIAEIRDGEWLGLDIVNVGTAMEYGLSEGDLAEDSLPKPTTLYGKSKLAGTNALTGSCRTFGLKGVTARLFSVYGPGESPRRLLPALVHAAQTETPIPLTAGLHKRDFVYVEDAAEGLLRLGSLSSLSGEPVNLATGVLSSIRTFTETAADTLGIDHERLIFGSLPTRFEEMSHKPVNLERLRALTGWVPNTTSASGIRKTKRYQNSPLPLRASVVCNATS